MMSGVENMELIKDPQNTSRNGDFVSILYYNNAFVKAGFGQDKLMTAPPDSSIGGSSGNWLFKDKEHGKTSATANLGMLLVYEHFRW